VRAAFADTLAELADRDDRILLLTGDLGYKALEPFSHRFPDRFFNVGVAEQNLMGLATGLADSGFIPFAYSIATFATLRGYEFIRNGPIAHRLPVRIVGMGGGFDYGSAGPTHHGLEDVGVMRLQPGITVLAPADSAQTRAILLATWEIPGPVYYRIGKDDRGLVPGLEGRFELGRTEIVRSGSDVLLLVMGSLAGEAAAAAEGLERSGVSCAVGVVSTLNPAPAGDLATHLQRFGTVISIEAHYLTGGLGSLVAEVIAERGLGCRLTRCAVREGPDGHSGSASYYFNRHRLSSEAIAESVKRALA